MARWTVEQALGHAPDSRSRKAALGLAKPGPWSELGSTESLVWGKCQGSGKTPYQVSVDLGEPAFKCSCPSRKIPCKHSVALLVLWARSDGAVAEAVQAADFAGEWAAQRAERVAKRAARRRAAPDPNHEERARRRRQRLDKMTDGLEDFDRWLQDLVRQGLAAARHQPYAYWDDAAARLVDAQVPGLAERVRNAGGAIHGRGDWVEHLLGELGKWHLAVRAWRRGDHLPDSLRGDLRSYLGWPFSGDEIRAGTTITDRWQVIGLREEDDGRLRSQRTWLYGLESRGLHLVLDFAAAGGALRVAHVLGSVHVGALALYPGSDPRRALLGDDITVDRARDDLPGAAGLDEALDVVTDVVAANPWTDRVPLCLAAVLVERADDGSAVVISDGRRLPIDPAVDVWELLAHTGGASVELFGEWEAGRLHPLTVVTDDGLVPL